MKLPNILNFRKKQTVLLICSLFFIGFSSYRSDNGWTSLLDKDLSKWNMYLSYRHVNDYKGEIPKDEKGQLITPIGYNKNEANVFSVIQMDREPVLRISGEIYGCVFTKQEFENYHLKLKVKWGSKKWTPRLEKLKDSGILYHSIGDCGKDYWRSWMLAQEFQVMEGHMGDYWNIANSAIDIKAFISEGNMNCVASEKTDFIPIGNGSSFGGFCLRSADYESPANEWTTLELICFGDKSIHLVNGHVVMILQHSRYMENGKAIPLAKGRIQLQSEAAEVFYKDIQIKSISALPQEYASYFKN